MNNPVCTTFGTFNYQEFKKEVCEFFKNVQDSSPEQIEAGVKAVHIIRLGLHGSDLEIYEAGILMDLITKHAVKNGAYS